VAEANRVDLKQPKPEPPYYCEKEYAALKFMGGWIWEGARAATVNEHNDEGDEKAERHEFDLRRDVGC